jgi:hypothetical protein
MGDNYSITDLDTDINKFNTLGALRSFYIMLITKRRSDGNEYYEL